jgi:hypothetical protein
MVDAETLNFGKKFSKSLVEVVIYERRVEIMRVFFRQALGLEDDSAAFRIVLLHRSPPVFDLALLLCFQLELEG